MTGQRQLATRLVLGALCCAVTCGSITSAPAAYAANHATTSVATSSLVPSEAVTTSDAASPVTVHGDWRGMFWSSGRYGHSAIHIPDGNRLIVFGGHDGVLRQHDVWVLTINETPTWTRPYQSRTKPTPRYTHSAIHDPVRDRMIIFGGDDGDPMNDTWAINVSGNMDWTELLPSGKLPPARKRHTAIYDPIGDRMIVFGGRDTLRRDDVWALPLSEPLEWQQITPSGSGPSPRYRHSAVHDPVRNRMLVFGGDDGGHRNDVWALELSGEPAWTRLEPEGDAPSRRRDHAAAYDAVRDRMIIFGGPEASENDAWALSLAGTPRWTELAPAGAPPAGQSDLVAVYDRDQDCMVVVGGRTATDEISNETSILSLAGAPTWSAVTNPGYGGSSYWHTTVYDPIRKRMISFGGLSDRYASPVNTTHVLSLEGPPRWSVLETAGEKPPGRKAHVAIYDPVGDRMVIFGGYAGAGRNFGGRLEDTWALSLSGTPTWQKIATYGVPPHGAYSYLAIHDSRRDHLVVYTPDYRDARHIWVLPLNGTPAWQQIATGGDVPPQQKYSSVTYDPLRDCMVVFGGYVSGGVPSHLSDVYTWSLATRAWTHVTPTGDPPIGRARHTGIYDPLRDRVVTWGGNYQGFEVSEVWALELAEPMTWTPLVPTGYPPAGREWHTAIYHPERDWMIIYGGSVPQILAETWILDWGSPKDPVRPTAICPADVEWAPGSSYQVRYVINNPISGRRAIKWTLESSAAWPGFPMRGVIDVDGASTQSVMVSIYVPDTGEPLINQLSFSVAFAGGASFTSTCSHTVTEAPTSALASLVTAAAGPGRAHLSWHVNTEAPVTVYRRGLQTPWAPLAVLIPDRGELTYIDDTVEPGQRYGYRLGWSSGVDDVVAGETWVDVPSTFELALHGVRPNPAVAEMAASLSLPAAGAVTLELYDVAGRRLGDAQTHDLSAGFHVVPITPRVRLAPGAYVVRMSYAGQRLHTNVVVIR